MLPKGLKVQTDRKTIVIDCTLNSHFFTSCGFSTPSFSHSLATKDNVFSFTVKIEAWSVFPNLPPICLSLHTLGLFKKSALCLSISSLICVLYPVNILTRLNI